MKTLIVHKNKIVSILTMFSIVLLMLTAVPAIAAEFEVGTQFGISHLVDENDYSSASVTLLAVPSGEIGSVPASPYLTWFPSKQLAIRPEFSFATSRSSTSYTTNALYLGGRFEFYLSSHEASNPYGLIRGSMMAITSDYDDLTRLRLGIGAGYQWRIRDNYVFRAEGQYLRALVEDETINGFSFLIGLGVRFGKNSDQQ